MYQAFAPQAREWRKPNEALSCRCTVKGSKEAITQGKFMVGISYDRGVVMCERYSSLSGPKYARTLYACLSQALNLRINPHDKRIVQNGDLAQISAVAKEIIDNLGVEVQT